MKRRRLPSNWRKRLELEVKENDKHLELILKFAVGKTPKGFRSRVGYIVVDVDHPHYIESSYIDSYFRGRGLGSMLYKEVLHKYGSISTAYHSASLEAQKVWKSLMVNHKYQTDFFTGRLTVFA